MSPCAYGWDDLAEKAEAEHLTEETETEFAYQKRFFWPAASRSLILARLLDLNRRLAAEESAEADHASTSGAGLTIRPPKRKGARQLEADLGGGKQFDFDLGD